jgi:hypothetical protein
MIPQMGYMALLRNIRNFEDAGVSAEALAKVEAKLTDPVEIAQSRQLPFRFMSAWRNSGTMRFGLALETALDTVMFNLPEFRGKTLIMVDTSASMSTQNISAKSKMYPMDFAALFGACVAHRAEKASLVMYADNAIEVMPERSVLRTIDKIKNATGIVGHGTNTWPCTQVAWNERGPFDRILVFTDGQSRFDGHAAWPSGTPADTSWIPRNVPVFAWDLAGYKTTDLELGAGRYQLGGLSDQSFKLIGLLEKGQKGRWPWEITDDQ